MSVLVIDTSVIVAAVNDREALHEKARQFLAALERGAWGTALLHEYVFLEVVTVLASRVGFAESVAVGERLLGTAGIEFVASSEDFTSVWREFRSQPRGKLSFADSALLTLAKARGATHLATFDKDLLKSSGLANATT